MPQFYIFARLQYTGIGFTKQTTSYVFIWMVTGDVNTITGTVLGLIGISATTALGSVLIDNGKSSDSQSQFTALQAEQAALQTRINELNAKANATPPTA